MALDQNEQVQVMKQELQMLLDIFTSKTNEELSTDVGTMKELLEKHLNRILIPVQEFMQWYIEKTKELDVIESKIERAKELEVSVPPLNYVGRIIISYTDATEREVIEHYGGKRWRRIENFLRGVGTDDAENIPGRKFGEDYVALRESNIPIHSHSETISNVGQTGSQEWAAKEKGGETTKLVNTPQDTEDTRLSICVKNTALDYQVSPLEYATRGDDEITLPHDNLPPYLKVYIWECTEITHDEWSATGEPDDGLCVITWLANGGTWDVTPVEPNTEKMTLWTRRIGKEIRYHIDGSTVDSTPGISKSGYEFQGWKCPDGILRNPEDVLDEIAIGNSFYVAQWLPKKCTVTFDASQDIDGNTYVGEP